MITNAQLVEANLKALDEGRLGAQQPDAVPCRYRYGSDGVHCAIGQVLPQEHYEYVDTLGPFGFKEHNECGLGNLLVKDKSLKFEDLQFAVLLQQVHDRWCHGDGWTISTPHRIVGEEPVKSFLATQGDDPINADTYRQFLELFVNA